MPKKFEKTPEEAVMEERIKEMRKIEAAGKNEPSGGEKIIEEQQKERELAHQLIKKHQKAVKKETTVRKTKRASAVKSKAKNKKENIEAEKEEIVEKAPIKGIPLKIPEIIQTGETEKKKSAEEEKDGKLAPEFGKSFFAERLYGAQRMREIRKAVREKMKEKGLLEKPFNLDAALDDKVFVDFLKNFPDVDVNDKERMKNIYNLFSAREEAKRRLRDLYKKELYEKAGLPYKETNMAMIDNYVDGLSIENPEQVKNIAYEFKIFDFVSKQIQTYEEKLSNLSGEKIFNLNEKDIEEKLKNLKQKRQEAEQYFRGFKGWFKWQFNLFGNKQEIKNTKENLKKWKAQIETLKSIEGLKRNLEQMKKGLIESLEVGKVLKDMAQKQVAEEFSVFFKPEAIQMNIKDLEKMRGRLDELESAQGAIDFLEKAQPDKIRETIKALLKNRVRYEILTKITEAPLEKAPKTEMEKIVQAYLDDPLYREGVKEALKKIILDEKADFHKRIIAQRIYYTLISREQQSDENN